MTPKRAVYTALIGRYESLIEQPAARESGIPLVCFTDDPELQSETWDVRLVEPAFSLDPVRSARQLKLIGHADLAEFEETLWVDNSVLLVGDPHAILDEWLAEADIAMPLHSYRRSVLAEFQEIMLTGMDDPTRLYEQLTHYTIGHPDVLESVPYWTALIARRHTEPVERFGRVWRDHVFRYSRRDQLSVRIAAEIVGISIAGIEIDNRESALHRWPVSERKQVTHVAFRTADMLQPPVAQVGQLQRQLDEVTGNLNEAIGRREAQITYLETVLAEIHASRAWKVARVLTSIRSLLLRRPKAPRTNG